MLKLGYKASAEQFGPSELLKFASKAEEVGFDSVFVSDHFQPWRHTDGHAPASLVWLGALAARTSRITIGTSVLTPTFRYHPAVIAQAFATLACLCPGRVVLGVGTGESLNEVPSTGIAWPEFKERLGRLREAIDLMRLLWTQERVTFAGQFYRTANATIYDRPEKPVPIFISAAGPTIARFVGQTADGFICTSGKTAEFYNDTLIPNLTAGLSSSGRVDRALERMIEMKVSFDTDKERALEDTRYWAALALSADEKISVEDPLQMERRAAELPIERVASRWIVSSDPLDQVERIRPYVQMGFTHLVFHAPGQDQERFLRNYASQVLPLLRKAFA
jgi:coenzyme F420-dependent glucose-6-phosphate dehydrogenase